MRKRKDLIIFILFLVVTTSIIYPQDYMDREVKFILDCWRYNFGWDTFGGGYIRYVLLFTEQEVVEIKTTQVSHTPGYSSGGYVSGAEKSLGEITLNIVLGAFIEELLKKIHNPQKETEQQLKEIIEQASAHPTVKNYFELISYILSQNKIGTKLSSIMKYNEMNYIKTKIRKEELIFSFKYKKRKYKYIAKFEDVLNCSKSKEILDELIK